LVADDTEFRFVAASVRRAVRLQRGHTETFLESAESGRSSIGAQFLELCDQIDMLVTDYEQRHATTSDPVDQRVLLNAIRELLAWTRDLQLRRAWLDAAATPPIDLGSLYFLASLAKNIVREDSELTVVATHEGSYATVVNPFRAPTMPVPDGIVLVALVPHRETRSGLLHPLLVHEIGHGVAKVHGFTSRLQSSLMSDEIEVILDEGASKKAAQSRRTTADERAVLDKRLTAWIEEVFCDAIASACLGATYLFSFATEVLPDDLDAAGLKHPPTRQRVRLIVEHLKRRGWGAVLRDEVPRFMSWISDVASGVPTPQSPDDEALRSAIDLIGASVQDAVDAHVGTHGISADGVALAAVSGLLQQHVPPAQMESSEAIDRPTIIVGCWLAALKDRGGTIDVLADAVDSPELGDLLPYALELSVIVDRWQAA
jgi:hypothetical protein